MGTSKHQRSSKKPSPKRLVTKDNPLTNTDGVINMCKRDVLPVIHHEPETYRDSYTVITCDKKDRGKYLNTWFMSSYYKLKKNMPDQVYNDALVTYKLITKESTNYFYKCKVLPIVFKIICPTGLKWEYKNGKSLHRAYILFDSIDDVVMQFFFKKDHTLDELYEIRKQYMLFFNTFKKIDVFKIKEIFDASGLFDYENS